MLIFCKWFFCQKNSFFRNLKIIYIRRICKSNYLDSKRASYLYYNELYSVPIFTNRIASWTSVYYYCYNQLHPPVYCAFTNLYLYIIYIFIYILFISIFYILKVLLTNVVMNYIGGIQKSYFWQKRVTLGTLANRFSGRKKYVQWMPGFCA